MSFIELEIELNPETLVEQVYEELEERFPGWEPNPNNPETWLVRAIVYRLIVPLAELAADVPNEVFYEFGRQVVNLPPIEATPASAESTWEVIDEAGYLIPVGTQVDVPVSGSEARGFRVVADVEVPAGKTKTETGEVLLEAVEAGLAGNGLSGTANLIDALAYIVPDGITLVGESTGGTDAEDPTDYLDRLAETMKTLAPRPIIASDVAILARNVAGVSRATVLDNFDPELDDPENPATWDTEKTTTVVPHDAEGNPCSAGVKEALDAELQAKREVNFVFYVEDPDYNVIDTEFTVIPMAGFSQAAVDAGVIASLEDLYSPLTWGQQPPGDETSWINQRTLRYQDVVTVVNNVQGVDYFSNLKIRKEGGEMKETDVVLAGAAPLPKPGKIEAGA